MDGQRLLREQSRTRTRDQGLQSKRLPDDKENRMKDYKIKNYPKIMRQVNISNVLYHKIIDIK